jgi:hypothetical protein
MDLSAVNTPQFDWARSMMGRKARPVPPVYQPEVPAGAVFFGAFNPLHQRKFEYLSYPTHEPNNEKNEQNCSEYATTDIHVILH